MPPKTNSLQDWAHDAARYGQRLSEIAAQLSAIPGDGPAEARALLARAADAAQEASHRMTDTHKGRLRLTVNTTNQNSLMVEATRLILETHPGDTPVVMRQGASSQNLPFAVNLTARLVSRLRALLGDDAVSVEARP